MTHLNDNLLRAWLDKELDDKQRQLVDEHLAVCTDCSRRSDQIHGISRFTESKMRSLDPDASIHFSAHKAIEKHLNRKKEPLKMKNFIRKPASIATGIAILIVVSLLFPPVRAMASNFLGLFRVQQVKVVSFDPAVLSQLDQDIQGKDLQIRQIFQDNIKKVQNSEFTQADNPQEAERLAGFPLRLPENSQVKSIGVVSGQKYEITIDTELWNSVLVSLGQESAVLPSDLNGQKITVDVPAGITAGIGDCKSISQARPIEPNPSQLSDCTLLIEMPSPVVKTPDNLDVPQLATSMLQILGMNADDARAFSQSTDWASTLVLPIPTGEDVSSQEISVDGTTATLITHETNNEFTLFWVKDGILNAVIGAGDSQVGIDLAASLP